MSKEKDRHIAPLVSFLLCTALAVLISLWQMSFQENSLLGRLRSWCDGCFAAGALWGALGLLLLIAGFDGFRPVQYLGYTFRMKWSKNRGEASKHLESYYDYVQEKKETQKEGRMVRVFLIPAAVYLVAATVLLVIFEQMR